MSAENDISSQIVAAQQRMFRLAERDHGLSRAALSLETGIPAPTLKSYEQGTQMPVSALARLARVIPNELTSLLLTGSGKAIADAEADDADIDDAVLAAVRLIENYVRARHPESPGGIRIVHNEIDDLRRASAALTDRAGKVA